MRIGIVILNWNGLELLQQYLDSVVNNSLGHTIYLADNASTDNSIDWVQQHYPQVRIISMDHNRGYTGGYNTAIPQVNESVVCLLNNDIEVTPQWLDPIVELLIADNRIAAVQPVLLDDRRRDHFEYAGAAGGYLDRLAYPYCRGRLFHTIERYNRQYDNCTDLHWVSGAAIVVNKEAFMQVGGLDQSYFAHQEEIDLCWRLRHAGYRLAVATDSVVYHLGGGTLAALHPLKTFYNFRNSLFNIVKNDHSKLWVLVLLARMVLDGIAGVYFIIQGKFAHCWAIIKAHLSFYSMLPSMIYKRGEVKKYSKSSKNESYVRSIVYAYFVNKIRVFKDL